MSLYNVTLKTSNNYKETNEITFITYVEDDHINDYEFNDIYSEDIAIQQSISKYFMSGHALYEGSTMSVVSVEKVRDVESNNTSIDHNVDIKFDWHDEESIKAINEVIEDLKNRQSKHRTIDPKKY